MIRTRTTHAEVSWVGLQRIRHAARDTHELGQDEGALLPAPCTMTNSMEIVFIPLRNSVIAPRSAGHAHFYRE